MRTSRDRFAAVILLAAGTLLATSACMFLGSNDDESTPTPTPPASATETPTPVATETPDPIPAGEWPEVTRARITTDDLNVRSGPGTSHAVVGRLQPDDEVPVSGRWPGGRWLALTGLGWIAYDSDWVDLDGALEELPDISGPNAFFEFGGAVHPVGASVDIPSVDQVVEAVVNRNRDAVLRMVTTDVPGSDNQENGATPTPTPTATATPAAPQTTSCSNHPLPASALEQHIDNLFESEVVPGARLQLYAVVRAPFPPGAEVEEGDLPEFVAVFAFERGEGHQIWIAPNGDITRFSFRCDPTPPGDLLRVNGGEPFFWLRPFTPAPLSAVE